MRRFLAIMCSVVLTLGLAGCGSKAPAAPVETKAAGGTETAAPAAGDEILIGCLQDISGPTSTLGKMVEAGAKWAIDEINEGGGVDGRKIRMITYDTKGDVNEAINAFTRAVTSDKVCVVIGPPIANIALAIAPISEQYNVPVVEFVLDPKAQVKEDGTAYKNMFSFQPNAISQGSILGSYAVAKGGFQTFGIIYNEGNAYSTSLLDPFIAAVEKNGATVEEKIAYNANDKDFKTLLGKIVNKNVDAIYAPNYTQELILIVQQARALGYEGALICGLDACPPFNTLLGEDCDNIFFINNVDATAPELQEMITKVKEKTGVDATNKFFLGYDAIGALSQIFAEVGTDPVAIRDAFEQVKDYQGLTGSITIDPATHMPVGLEMVVFTYEGTTPVMLERYLAE